MIHELKILPEYFEAVTTGKKTFEVRVDDRDFHVGDFLALNEWRNGYYTGNCCLVEVTYIFDDKIIIDKSPHVIMAIRPCRIGTMEQMENLRSSSLYRVETYPRPKEPPAAESEEDDE